MIWHICSTYGFRRRWRIFWVPSNIKKKKKKHGFLFVGSIYIKREPIIVLIEQDSAHDMGFRFEDLISKMVREKLFFNM